MRKRDAPAETGLKEDVQRRLSRIAGQVQGLARMVEADRYCIDVLQQIASVQEALRGVARTITRSHLDGCVTHGLRSRDEARASELREELLEIMFKYAR